MKHESCVPLIDRDGNVLVSKRKYPSLHRSLQQGAAPYRKERADWLRVSTLRAKGRPEQAQRIARRLMGIEGPPMSEEVKAKLKQYNLEHADEIRQRREQKAALRHRTKEILKKGPRKIRRGR